ncbi:unnamed protein product, partial [Tetraodon nigroviridis]
DSDDVEEESEGESNSGEDDGEEEEEEEEANEDDDDDDDDDGIIAMVYLGCQIFRHRSFLQPTTQFLSDEEEDAKAEDETFGRTAGDLAGMSSDEDSDKCPICLNSFISQLVATPENCEHYFCLDCILEWTKNANSCPIDRITFNNIYLRKSYGGKVEKMKPVKSPEERVDVDLEHTNCEVCGGSDREDRLLLCDSCDAGYHMECLTPSLDTVPVEEWFCPECVANNRHLRSSAEGLNDTESLPSTARHATRRHQAAGTTRAIARTQQSERVRANVNRHRITQARTSQLAPTYLIQSTWLDETINAVIAGLNSSVYMRDLTPRATHSRRSTTKRRKTVKRKKTSSGSNKTASKGVKRKKRRGRTTKSRKKLALKKTTTPRSRIATSLGMAKDKKGSSLPTVYRPSEQTLSGMRADIGAASLSIYGDPFDLDPFVDQDEEVQEAHASSVLEAKRRGISRSALRSHQPVARPVTASFSSSFSSSSAGLSANHPHHTASSSSTSTVSFRINSSGNSWHSRRLSMGSSSGSSSSIREVGKEKKDEARKKQLRRDKQMLLASRTLGNKEEDGDSIYDPFNPTQSDSSSSEDEAESRRLGGSSQNTAHDRRAASSEKDTDTKEETQELVISEEESSRTSLQDKVSMEVRRSKVEKVSRAEDTETEKQTPCDHKVKQESVEELSTNAVNPSTFLKNDSSASNKKTEKAKTRNEFASKSPTRDFSQKVFHSLKEQRTGSSETHRGGRLAHNSSDHAIKEKGENKDRKPSSGHSRVRKRGSARSSSESSSSDSPNRTHSRQSRSSSSSGSRECSQRRKHNPRSTEERTVKDNRCGPSRSESPPELCCESRSRGSTCPSPLKSHSRSRSRSRERRKDKTRPQQPASTSRHQGEPKSKPSRGLRSRSRSKERRKEEESSKSSQKTSSFCVPSSKDVKEAQAKKREDIVPNKEDKGTAGKKQEAQSKDLSANSQAATPATHKKRALLKEIKREKPPTFDIFEESAGAKAVKEEESDICGLMAVKKEEDYKGFKTEACEIPIFKSEASSPESCPSVTLVSPLTEPGGLQDPLDQLQPALLACAAQPDPAEQTVAMRQETQQPSDSDDDFNVDVMLDSLQYEKPGTTGERSEQRSEAAVEGGTASVSKSKNQVKRVTWNIQEPEGPQPEKSPSKLALYKLKLKQEGVRRPSTGQNSSQYLKKLHMQERAVEEVKLAIKPFYQRRDINKDEYKEILRKAVQKVGLGLSKTHEIWLHIIKYSDIYFFCYGDQVCHSKSGEINPMKVGNLVRAYVDKYKHARKHKKGEDTVKIQGVQTEALKPSGSP